MGHLFEVSKTIIESEDDEKKIGEWLTFINGSYEEMRVKITSNYGGIVPPRHAVKFEDINVEGDDAGFNSIGIPQQNIQSA